MEFKERSGASPALLPLLQRTGTDRKPEAGVRHSLLSSTPQKQLSSGDFLKIVTTFPREREKKQTIKVGAGIEASTDEPCSRCVSGVENLQMSSYSHFLSSQSTPAPPQPRCHFWDFSLSLLLSHRPRLCVWIGGIYK